MRGASRIAHLADAAAPGALALVVETIFHASVARSDAPHAQHAQHVRRAVGDRHGAVL